MAVISLRNQGIYRQFLWSVSMVLVTSLIAFLFSDVIGYRTVALILLFVVSLAAILFRFIPVIIAALLSAIIWNYFFIPPIYTWNIDNPEDTLMFLMYFVIATINAVLTYKLKDIEKQERDKVEKEKTITLYNTLLNTLSHELRTPISTIIGAIDTIQDKTFTLSKINVADLHDEIKTASLRLNHQVENLLNISRLESGILKPKLDWCDINEIIFNILSENKQEFVNHRILFNPVDNFPLFKTDRIFIQQIIHNILVNSARYTPHNTQIHIQLESNTEGFCIIISDNGYGFPEKEIPFVFDKFYRLSTNKKKGIGLGLSIVKGFTEALNGRVFLENKNSGGAKFRIEIPALSSTNEVPIYE